MTDDLLHCPFGTFQLLPLHHQPRSPLRAWNAADELLLQTLAQQPLTDSTRILVVNDHSGALAVSLHQWAVDSWNDHFTSRLALRHNLARNGQAQDAARFIPATAAPAGPYDVVLLQLPKTLSLLEYQLLQLRPHVHADTLILAGGMVKHMTLTMSELFARIIGPVQASRAEKKARLLHSHLDPALTPEPVTPVRYGIPDSPLQLVNHANVFSQQKLDIGTRFLLQQLPDLGHAHSILDLGCGNGALGIYAGWRYPQAALHFVDDSYLALRSAEDACHLNGLGNSLHFYAADALEDFDGEVDAILCNPPFHEGNRVHTAIAARMFAGAARHLTREGCLTIVANRHLDYRPLLQPHFRELQLLAGNPKFVILAARQPRRR